MNKIMMSALRYPAFLRKFCVVFPYEGTSCSWIHCTGRGTSSIRRHVGHHGAILVQIYGVTGKRKYE